MDIVAKVGKALQRVVDGIAESASQTSGAVQRKRKFTPPTLGKTLVLGFLPNPQANDEELAQVAGQ